MSHEMEPQFRLRPPQFAEQRAQADLPDQTGAPFHLPVGKLARRLLRAAPEPLERIAEGDSTGSPLRRHIGEPLKHTLRRELQ